LIFNLLPSITRRHSAHTEIVVTTLEAGVGTDKPYYKSLTSFNASVQKHNNTTTPDTYIYFM